MELLPTDELAKHPVSWLLLGEDLCCKRHMLLYKQILRLKELRAVICDIHKSDSPQRLFRQLHDVTQWKSDTSSTWGRDMKSSQENILGLSTNPEMVKDQSSNSIFGWTPKSRTGQLVTILWPGGCFGLASLFKGSSPWGSLLSNFCFSSIAFLYWASFSFPAILLALCFCSIWENI